MLVSVPIAGLSDEAIRALRIAIFDIRRRIGCSEDDRRDCLQAAIILEVRQDLAAVHFWQVQIQQDEVWTSSVGVRALLSKEGNSLHAISNYV